MKINNILMIGVSVSVLLLTSCGGEDVPETETPAPIVTVAQETGPRQFHLRRQIHHKKQLRVKRQHQLSKQKKLYLFLP